MKIKRIISSFLCGALVLFNFPVMTFASQIPVTGDTGSGSTPSNIIVTADMLDGSDLIVTIPDNLILGYDNESGKVSASSVVNVKGIINPGNVVKVSTPLTITFTHKSDSSITAQGSITFGESGVSTFTAKALHDSGDLGTDSPISCEAIKNTIEYIGEYESTIPFNVDVVENGSLTYFLGYSYSEENNVSYANNSSISYTEVLPQTDIVAELKEISTDRNAILSKGYDKVVLSTSTVLDIPEQIDGHEVVGVSLDSFFNDSKVSSYVTNIELPETVTGVNLGDNTSSSSPVVISCENWRVDLNISGSKPSASTIECIEAVTLTASNFKKYTSYDSATKTFTISDAVRYINCNVSGWNTGFYQYCASSEIEKIILPKRLKSIYDNGGFYNFTALKSIEIPDTVTYIGTSAFYDCTNLTSVTIPNSVKTIGDSAFSGCEKLKSISIPSSVTSLGEDAFSDCDAFTSVTIPGSIQTIGESAFERCANLRSIVIEEGVKTIGYEAIAQCSRLTSLVIPTSITRIEGYNLWYCSNLKTITYLGTMEQFRAISYTDLFINGKTVRCTDGDISF